MLLSWVVWGILGFCWVLLYLLGQRALVENNYLSVSEKTELEIAKQTLKNSKDPAEREKVQQKYDALLEKILPVIRRLLLPAVMVMRGVQRVLAQG